ncbi:helix-turn-helix domain-containing protein [Cellulomonas sp. APG4]|uniref:helix-turn-helix domain-containing protein n=1 Tax=Cellulomonas sp. APG4 TaxID=1538656 RepID=UPI00192A38CF|nr:helix-turn-helix domain-containing protein [Cellulomonas sp. APG4]
MTSHDATERSKNDWLTSAEAVALLPGVTIRTLQRWADSGKVPSATLPSGRRRFRRADIEALLEVSRSAS